jgi:hypothetical protein
MSDFYKATIFLITSLALAAVVGMYIRSTNTDLSQFKAPHDWQY